MRRTKAAKTNLPQAKEAPKPQNISALSDRIKKLQSRLNELVVESRGEEQEELKVRGEIKFSKHSYST